jgi:hypothetical protein
MSENTGMKRRDFFRAAPAVAVAAVAAPVIAESATSDPRIIYVGEEFRRGITATTLDDLKPGDTWEAIFVCHPSEIPECQKICEYSIQGPLWRWNLTAQFVDVRTSKQASLRTKSGRDMTATEVASLGGAHLFKFVLK